MSKRKCASELDATELAALDSELAALDEEDQRRTEVLKGRQDMQLTAKLEDDVAALYAELAAKYVLDLGAVEIDKQVVKELGKEFLNLIGEKVTKDVNSRFCALYETREFGWTRDTVYQRARDVVGIDKKALLVAVCVLLCNEEKCDSKEAIKNAFGRYKRKTNAWFGL